ncbi:MAG: glycerol kinase GlpK [Firmicutes bacterium]|jgi:glycerol kinase|nr:glycerol kinase GlpK [Bacillota bacterium]
MEKYIIALDQGTTSCRCILFNKQGTIVSMAQKEYKQYYPKAGWVEHNPNEIWQTQLESAQKALQQIGADYKNISAIGITNQRETTVIWDKNTGEPIYPAIVWQCRRTADYCDSLIKKGLADTFRKKTGLLIDSYFSATKIHWILQNVPHAKQKAEKGDLLFGTTDTWLIWKLTKGAVHATDYSNASRTMLFNINTLQWDTDILKELEIPKAILPAVHPSSFHFGNTHKSIFGGEIPITGVAGDQQSALFGQNCFTAGSAKNTYGTGCFLLMNTGNKPVFSTHGLLTTIAWGIDNQITYALEGSVFTAGAAIQWLRDELHMIQTASETQKIAEQVPDNNGVYMVPAFAGLGAPHWDAYARGTIIGLTAGVNYKHIIRATLESLAYQTYDVLKAMEEDSNIALKCLRVDGGACANDFIMQFQSDIIGVPIERPVCIETTALGAAYLAGLYVGYWNDKKDISQNCSIEKSFYSTITEEVRQKNLKGWHKAVHATLGFAK